MTRVNITLRNCLVELEQKVHFITTRCMLYFLYGYAGFRHVVICNGRFIQPVIPLLYSYVGLV